MTAPAPPAAWEYQTVPVVAAGFEDAAGVENYRAILNEYGRGGWEMVSAVASPGWTVGGTVVVLFLKRPVR